MSQADGRGGAQTTPSAFVSVCCLGSCGATWVRSGPPPPEAYPTFRVEPDNARMRFERTSGSKFTPASKRSRRRVKRVRAIVWGALAAGSRASHGASITWTRATPGMSRASAFVPVTNREMQLGVWRMPANGRNGPERHQQIRRSARAAAGGFVAAGPWAGDERSVSARALRAEQSPRHRRGSAHADRRLAGAET